MAFIFPLVLIGSWLGTWAAWNWARTIRRRRQLELSLQWPIAKGVVTLTQTVWAHVEVNYEYAADDKSYAGRYDANLPVTPYRGMAATMRLISAEKALEAEFAQGKFVWVKYDPELPSHSILIRSAEVG
jgi:enoyl-CoA hydratase/carnithine racemase